MAPLTLQERIEGLVVYRACFGHSWVPNRFVVPHADPWPRRLRGAALGRDTDALRSLMVRLEPYLEDALENLGFVWFKRYDRAIARCFDTSTGLKHMTAYQYVLEALKRFHALHGHVCVPEGFVVPKDDTSWPTALRNVDLAHALHILEVHPYALSTAEHTTAHGLGLVLDAPLWADVIEMLDIYKNMNGAADVPVDYVVHATRKRSADGALVWPSRYDGVKLGEVARRVWLLSVQLPAHRQDDLAAVKFAFDTLTSWRTVLRAKAAFASVHGHDDVPVSYVVPFDDAMMPVQWRGFRLGHYLLLHRQSTGRFDRPSIEPIYEMAARPDLSHLDRLVVGLKRYVNVFGDSLVPPTFVVPASSSRWPKQLWQFALGDAVASLRADGAALSALERATVNDTGFVWDPSLAAMWPDLLHALSTWRDAHRDAPFDDAFVCPLEWPAAVAGKPLGHLATLLAVHDDFRSDAQKRAVRLHQIDLDARWSAKRAALAFYFVLHQHLRVPSDFVVPSGGGWPPASAGMPLGAVVKWLRQVPPAAMVYARRRELEALQFEWFSTAPATEVDAPTELPQASKVHASEAKDEDDVDWVKWTMALTKFKLLEGHIDVPVDYMVPTTDVRWPAPLHRFPLGAVLADVQSGATAPPAWSATKCST
ncbi:hypothetical protein SPRG_03403 [Saprolegnia parasitica CBS 223.65]|uniref:Helicase-associated domain-containing protein n=1 Tax=Saprolegnia parasitica (strain CBS 223.65) TaxID=695850 RepID=A0A067D0C6_SAPPC|nr:hypothetical protein SPRG_03403 [Saprolegnia parasitica CBS 223.65]KDO32186.1 hypothetical protein SPRG_03403 [Saprolegnia parasitica CBS 223.65]|eukprot:XP_012197367.1 hypothetical protein SPRG_03403 [Saprolegnia parasitica CBS 223.65]